MQLIEPGALGGVRVLECAHILSGPICGQLLADAGADVIKVERPGLGDPTRAMGPYGYGPDGRRAGGYFMRLNRGKRSVAIDLKHPAGLAAFQSLIRQCDVLLENYTPGTMARLGLDYERVRTIRPDIIYASISGFGNPDAYPGPYDSRPALNEVAQAMGGIMDLNGEAGGPPLDVAVPVGDIMPAALAAFGVAAALTYRARTGRGKRLDLSMLDAMVFLNERSILQYSLVGRVPHRGKAGTTSFGGVFAARDGFLAVRVLGDAMWSGFCRALDLPELREDPRFVTDIDRMEHSAELKRIFEDWLGSRDRDEAADLLIAGGVAAGPVRDAREVFEDPLLRGRGMWVEVEDPVVGTVVTAASPVRYTGDPAPSPRRLPMLGEHTHEVLTGLAGLTESEVRRLVEEGVVACA